MESVTALIKQRSRCGNVANTEKDGWGRAGEVFDERNNPKVAHKFRASMQSHKYDVLTTETAPKKPLRPDACM